MGTKRADTVIRSWCVIGYNTVSHLRYERGAAKYKAAQACTHVQMLQLREANLSDFSSVGPIKAPHNAPLPLSDTDYMWRGLV